MNEEAHTRNNKCLCNPQKHPVAEISNQQVFCLYQETLQDPLEKNGGNDFLPLEGGTNVQRPMGPENNPALMHMVAFLLSDHDSQRRLYHYVKGTLLL